MPSFWLHSMPVSICPVLLCGGSGTRLWPVSRKSYPKQFADLVGDESLFQASARRLSGQGFAAPLIVTAEDFRFIVTEQLTAVQVAPTAILIEPEARNTAAAILAAALHQARIDPQTLMIVAPSDHVVEQPQDFREAVRAAVPQAQRGHIITFGIRPTRAETGYGYLQLAERPGAGPPAPLPLARFIEKPPRAYAEELIASGHTLWNAGIFLFTVSTLIAAFERLAPETLALVTRAVDEARPDLGFTRLAPEPWSGLDDISIDYAIMERAGNLMVMPYGGAWSDLGDWHSVWRESDADADGNVMCGAATAINCSGSLLRGTSETQELVGIGLDNIIAVATPDAILVARKDCAQDVKIAVQTLKSRGARQATEMQRTHRPWGWYETLVAGPRFHVKRIVVNPAGTLSLQSHHHRSEHWVVVEGTAHVTIGGETRLAAENESVYVPLGAIHRLHNPGKIPLVLIEVQTGGYLAEDDIVRHEDVYARP